MDHYSLGFEISKTVKESQDRTAVIQYLTRVLWDNYRMYTIQEEKEMQCFLESMVGERLR